VNAPDVLRRVSRLLVTRCAISPTTPIACAVSGGADSVALAELLAAIGRPPAVVVFIDHGLRDVAAERAAAEAVADRVRAPFAEARLTLPTRGNLQALARAARYRALLALTPEGGVLATGHTLSDQAETVLQRMLRGAGLSGLAGLAARRGRLIRPLLEVTRAETRALATAFADDPTNATPRFQRNRVRALLEALEGEAPGASRALAELARAAAASNRLLDAVALATTPDLRGLEPDVIATFAHHLARAATGGHSSASREGLLAWARALSEGGLGRTSLGDALAGVAQRGRPSVTRDHDPRHDLVAPRPGHYVRGAVALTLTVTTTPLAASDTSFSIPLERVRWPVSLVRIPGAGRRDGLDDAADRRFELVDATGQALGRPLEAPPVPATTHWIHAEISDTSTSRAGPVVLTPQTSVPLGR
jgi:tRNA(Ile)-lysidine synthetase-like protein